MQDRKLRMSKLCDVPYSIIRMGKTMKKLRVGICDDDSQSLSAVKDLLLRLGQELNIAFEILEFADGADLVESYPQDLSLLFLDIEMPFLNGLETAREIRDRDAQVTLVFMSNYEKYAIHGYEFGAWRYLLKPVTWEKFERELRRPIEALSRKDTEFLYVKNSEGVFSLPYDDLYYAETNYKKNVDLHLSSRIMECYQSLTALETQLTGHSFFRCHSGFLVNLAYVSHIGKDSLTLRDGSKIPVSKHRRKELMAAFLDYGGKLL